MQEFSTAKFHGDARPTEHLSKHIIFKSLTLSAFGTKRTSHLRGRMSAFGSKADISQRTITPQHRATRYYRRRRETNGLSVPPPRNFEFRCHYVTLGLACASAEECDYKTCGALMTRDGSVSWGISGLREYAPDTKRACAELNACVRRAKNNSAGRAAPALAAGSSSSKSNQNGSATALKPQPADKQAKGAQSASTSAVHESGNAIPNADRSNGKPTPCFAVAEILVPLDCSPSGPQ